MQDFQLWGVAQYDWGAGQTGTPLHGGLWFLGVWKNLWVIKDENNLAPYCALSNSQPLHRNYIHAHATSNKCPCLQRLKYMHLCDKNFIRGDPDPDSPWARRCYRNRCLLLNILIEASAIDVCFAAESVFVFITSGKSEQALPLTGTELRLHGAIS
jgi:hypothetical protein